NPYTCAGKEGNSLFCKLPLPGHTDFTPQANIVFVPDPEHLCDAPRAPAPDVDMDEVEDVTPIDDEDYNLEDLTDVTDDHAYRRWMVDSQKKNNSLLRRILKGITGGCIGNQGHQPRQRARRPGKEPVGTSSGGESLPQNRRTADHSGSGESD